MQNKLQKKYPAQIMIIVLVLMSVLSIIALSATLTSVRDTEEKTQNTQYQSYYAVGEQKLLDFQQKLGRQLYDNTVATELGVINGDTGTISGTCDVLSKTCIYDPIDTEQYNTTGTKEKVKTSITITDLTKITDFLAKKDKDILIDLEDSSGDILISFSWEGSNVAWNLTIDKLDYTSEKTVYNPDGGPYGGSINPATGLPVGSCFYFTSVTSNEIKFTIPTGCLNRMYFRLRPIMTAGSVKIITLSLVGNTKPLQRVLKSITTTSGTTEGSGNPDNPTAVLETTYLLVAQPFSLFDYVLRTEDPSGVVKN